MSRETLTRLREQAERSSLEVRIAALLHISRVEAVYDREAAIRTFEAALEATHQMDPEHGQWMRGRARDFAAAVCPERLDSIPAEGRIDRHYLESSLIRTMVQHGHGDYAISRTLEQSSDSEFPMTMVGLLLHRSSDPEIRVALFRRAVEAWRKGEHGDSPTIHFVQLFQMYWNLLAPDEALAIAREIIEEARHDPPQEITASLDREGQVTITNFLEYKLFLILHAVRALDSDLADTLIRDHPQLANAVRRFPNGMESIAQEGRAQAEEAKSHGGFGGGRGGGGRGGFSMSGSSRDVEMLRALMSASQDGNFEPSLTYALERYADDSSHDSPNTVPKEFWPSSNEFRKILHDAGKQLGESAATYLNRIPDEDRRLLAAIELEATLVGLPAMNSVTMGRRQRPTPVPEETIDDDICGPHIRCPKCNWQPRKGDRWACKCGHWWNTFDTGGVCPGCLHQWKDTQCRQCGEWSPHSDWYAKD